MRIAKDGTSLPTTTREPEGRAVKKKETFDNFLYNAFSIRQN